jgi:hypothetical protein
MGTDLAEVDRKVNDFPGYIDRKFQEQAVQIVARGKTQHDETRARMNLLLTGLAAGAAILSACVAAFTLLTRHA